MAAAALTAPRLRVAGALAAAALGGAGAAAAALFAVDLSYESAVRRGAAPPAAGAPPPPGVVVEFGGGSVPPDGGGLLARAPAGGGTASGRVVCALLEAADEAAGGPGAAAVRASRALRPGASRLARLADGLAGVRVTVLPPSSPVGRFLDAGGRPPPPGTEDGCAAAAARLAAVAPLTLVAAPLDGRDAAVATARAWGLDVTLRWRGLEEDGGGDEVGCADDLVAHALAAGGGARWRPWQAYRALSALADPPPPVAVLGGESVAAHVFGAHAGRAVPLGTLTDVALAGDDAAAAALLDAGVVRFVDTQEAGQTGDGVVPRDALVGVSTAVRGAWGRLRDGPAASAAAAESEYVALALERGYVAEDAREVATAWEALAADRIAAEEDGPLEPYVALALQERERALELRTDVLKRRAEAILEMEGDVAAQLRGRPG